MRAVDEKLTINKLGPYSQEEFAKLVQLVYTVNSRYSGHPWDYPKWLEYRSGRISGYLDIPAAIYETVSRASSPACKVIVTG